MAAAGGNFRGWPAASAEPERGIDALVGDALAVVQARGVDAEQHFDAVPGPLGDLGGWHSSVEPQGDRSVPQVVWAPGQRRGNLTGGEREGPCFGPDVTDRRGRHDVATL